MSTKIDFSLLPHQGRVIGGKIPKGNFPESIIDAVYYKKKEDPDTYGYQHFVQGNWVETFLFCQDAPVLWETWCIIGEFDFPYTGKYLNFREYYTNPIWDLGVSFGMSPLLNPDKATYDLKEIITGTTETNNVKIEGYQLVTIIMDRGYTLTDDPCTVDMFMSAITESAINYGNYQFSYTSLSDSYIQIILREQDYTEEMKYNDNYFEYVNNLGGINKYKIVGIHKEHTK